MDGEEQHAGEALQRHAGILLPGIGPAPMREGAERAQQEVLLTARRAARLQARRWTQSRRRIW